MRLLLACLATVVLAAPTDAVRVNLPTDQPVEIHVGQKLELVIAGNPTTGYKWKLESLPEGMAQVGETAAVLKMGSRLSSTAEASPARGPESAETSA